MTSTPMRAVRVPDDIWDAAQARARAEGTTVSAIIRATLRHYAALPAKVDPAERAALSAERAAQSAESPQQSAESPQNGRS